MPRKHLTFVCHEGPHRADATQEVIVSMDFVSKDGTERLARVEQFRLCRQHAREAIAKVRHRELQGQLGLYGEGLAAEGQGR